MRRLTFRILIALLTFALGLASFYFWFSPSIPTETVTVLCPANAGRERYEEYLMPIAVGLGIGVPLAIYIVISGIKHSTFVIPSIFSQKRN